MAQVTESELVKALSDARALWESFFGYGQVFGTDEQRLQAKQAMLSAERTLAGARGQSYAEIIDLGVRWDAGAPLPHLLTGERIAVVLCRAEEPDPEWDGTYVHPRSPSDAKESGLIEITFDGCAAARIGSPDQDTIPAHPLWGRGLVHYEALVVRNSDWIAERSALHAADDREQPAGRVLNHYFLGFHDESVEALARSITARLVRGTTRTCLIDVVNRLTSTQLP